MTQVISKGAVDKLGIRIREELPKLHESTLSQLQDYRTSHNEVLTQTFNFLCELSKKTHPTTIVTYRIKRIESITGKLIRYPKMRFSQMGDIGGCRCIMKSNNDVYKLEKLINESPNFEIVKKYDYIKEPQKTGYRALHLFLKKCNQEKIIEVQLRNLVDHNWATLVEITDLLFDSKLKEYGQNEELLQFHLLLSNIQQLTLDDKKRIVTILQKYNYFETLSGVFSRNYVKVRRQWFEIENQHNHRFFMIETTKSDVPKILSFQNGEDAEMHYLDVYKQNQNANIVVTHLQRPNYNQISIAYSNYVLTFHTFLNECFKILESVIIEDLKKRSYREYFKHFSQYNSLNFTHISNLYTESLEIDSYANEKRNRKAGVRKKEKEWIGDIEKQVKKSQERSRKLSVEYRKNMPESVIGRFIVKNITNHLIGQFSTKIKSLIKIEK